MPLEIEGARFWLRDGAPPCTGARLARALARIRAGALPDEKTGRRKSLFHVEDEAGALLWKRNDYDVAASWRRALRASKSRHELRLAGALALRGVPAVVPLAAGEERSHGRLVRCHLVVERIEDATDLARLWLDRDVAPAERRALAHELGVLARTAHEAGLLQDDFAPNNVLVAPGAPRLRLVDFERARLGRAPASEAWRAWMIAKLERALPALRDVDRWRFVRAYAGADRAAARMLASRLAGEIAGLAARDVRRLARHAARDGRRLRRVDGADLQGIAQRELADEALARIAGAAPGRQAEGLPVPLRDGSAHALRAAFGLAAALAARGHGLVPLAAIARRGVGPARARERAGLAAERASKQGPAARLLFALHTRAGEPLLPDAEPDDAARRVLLRRLRAIGLELREGAPTRFGCVEGLRGHRRAVLLAPEDVVRP